MGFTPEQMHGNQITVRTLDLYQPFNNIRQALDQIADSHFSMYEGKLQCLMLMTLHRYYLGKIRSTLMSTKDGFGVLK